MKAEILEAIKNLEEAAEKHGGRRQNCANGLISDTAEYLYESYKGVEVARLKLLSILETTHAK